LEQNQPDIVVMKGGRVMVVRHGEMKELDMMMTLENGTRVAMDGTLTMRDGTTRRLTEGEAMTLDGEPTTAVDQHIKNK
jgi:hypothetical protein